MTNCLLQEALWSEKIWMQRKTVTCLPHFHKKPPTLYMAIMDICKFFIMIFFLIPMEFSFLWIITCTLGTGMFLYMVKTRFWLMLKLRLYVWLIVQQCYTCVYWSLWNRLSEIDLRWKRSTTMMYSFTGLL